LAEYQLRKGQALDEAGLFFDPEALSEAERHTLPDGSGPILPTCEKQSTAQDSLGSNCKGQRGFIVPRTTSRWVRQRNTSTSNCQPPTLIQEMTNDDRSP
jgi:hypothetical protein